MDQINLGYQTAQSTCQMSDDRLLELSLGDMLIFFQNFINNPLILPSETMHQKVL